MTSTGTIQNISLDYKTKKPVITLQLDATDSIESLEQIKDDKLSVEIKKWRKKRSLDANAYCWLLCDRIAKELSKDGTIHKKEEIYQDTIMQIGTFEPFIVQENGLDKFKRIWQNQGLGFVVQEVNRKDKCVRVNCYYGSSTYDSKEMSLLIELLVDTAKSLNIETMPKQELESLLRSWK